MKNLICFFMFFAFSAQVANAETFFRFSCAVLNSRDEVPNHFTLSENTEEQKSFVRFMGNSPLTGEVLKTEALQALTYENSQFSLFLQGVDGNENRWLGDIQTKDENGITDSFRVICDQLY